MRKLSICTMWLLIAASSFCQQTDIRHSSYQQDYLQKSKRQKTAAWVLLAGGAAVTVGAIILDVSGDWSKSETPYLIAMAAGGASMLGSIPLFIASKRNKKKGLKASTYFDIRQNILPIKTGFALHAMPTLSLKFVF